MASVSLVKPIVASQSVLASPSESVLSSSSRAPRAPFLFEDESNKNSARCLFGVSPVCLQGPVLKTRTQRTTDLLSSPFQGGQRNNSNSSTIFRNGIFISSNHAATESPALIEIEDEIDGSIVFKYGGLEDIWELDKMLEFLCRGAFSTYNVESLVPIVVELLKVPVSPKGQRRMVEMLSSYVQTNRNVRSCEAERMISQILAEVTSEFLPPPTTGNFKGRRRPDKRFSSRLDKWWRKLDSYLGAGEDDSEFWGDDEFGTFEHQSFRAEPLAMNGQFSDWNDHGFTPLKAAISRSFDSVQTRFTWKDAPSAVNWISSPSESLLLEAPKVLEYATEQESALRPSEERYTSGAGFVFLSSQVETLEDVLNRNEHPPSSWRSGVRSKTPPSSTDTLPISSIQAMLEWEQEETVVTSVNVATKKSQTKKTTKTTQRTRSKTVFQTRSSSSTKSATKKRNHSEKREERKLCDIFFTLPLNHSNSGIASFLQMRKGLSNEILVVLNQGSVVLAGGGLAVVLHVAARMLSINSTFDRYKMFGLIRGAALIWLSAAMQKLRSVLILLPAECTITNHQNKKQLLSLQHQLKTLSFKALAVMVLSVVGSGI
ncbi:hypothetical protein MPTK1_7g14110 [Marchantia polymorpha subsp. ruderalis]|uniref:Uncharacterized protein n=2 Tax=Marchantia polymorpha TaxID=3197 RepID=A0A176VMY4_MARPO|nr:hypothetical protein AXG93_2550s1210 [Marchantia polymorpha subsp. ruderalis]PTQ46992.1 hypothetical protein MARPO_0009s0096 [Marchantia polymorpha]BBN17387.1 hypothetical protein Mp_7g14110 [Marchantia polymorpha subsp. ruderalis]|eukprot:PTQ46992.1 hypothetical protein MARPO_0009s0096 [Marchantia polymorpha]